MFGIPGFASPTGDFLSLVEARVGELFDQHGLKRSTDAAAGGSGPMAMLADLEPPGEGYDDRPAIERVIAAISTAAKKMKTSRSASFRLLGCNPATCSALVIVVGTYTPVSPENAADVHSLSRWTLALRCKSTNKPEFFAFDGDVMDATALSEAIETLAGMCAYMQQEHSLQPTVRRNPYGSLVPPELLGGGFMPADAPSVATEG